MTVNYYWYDHLLLRENGDAEKVQKAIKEHDFDTFMKFYLKYTNITSEGEDIVFFPEYASIYINDDYVGEYYILSEYGFNQITDSEFECG